MPRRIKGPDGKIHMFPDNATDVQISSALKAIPEANKPSPISKVPTWSDQLGLNRPTDSRIMGFNRGMGSAAVDMAQGAVANITNRVNRGGDPALRTMLGSPPVEEAQDVMQAPETFAGGVGGMLPAAAEMAIPGPGVVKGGKAVINAIPRTARAAEKFQDVMGAARNVPVDVSDVGNVALRVQQLAERGGAMPLVVRKLLNRLTDPEKAPMVYEEARDFASNISRLSADEMRRLTPVIRREVANLSVAMNKANAMAAKQAGKLEEYQSAMREYARAMRMRDIVTSAVEGAKRAALPATAAGAGYWLTKKLIGGLDGGGGGER